MIRTAIRETGGHFQYRFHAVNALKMTASGDKANEE